MVIPDENWKSEFPTEAGFYWFCGDPYVGQSGGDYTPEGKALQIEMHIVHVWKNQNGVTGVINGGFIYRQPFDKAKHREGWVGKFAPADLPEFPNMADCTQGYRIKE